MTQIIRKDSDGIEFFTIKETGESGMSISGLARLAGVGQDSIVKILRRLMTSSCPDFLKSLQDIELTLMTSVNEFNNATILKAEVCAFILEWYAFESQRTNDTARFSYRKFAKQGINTWIQSITGWEKNQPKQEQSPYIVRLNHFNFTKKFLPKNHWCVFGETANLLSVISEQYPVGVYDLVDGSVGKRWAIYRNDKEWQEPRLQYPHHFPDQRGIKDAWCYSFKELPFFREWFQDIYEPNHLPEYLRKKYGELTRG